MILMVTMMIWDLFQKDPALPRLDCQQGFCLLHLEQRIADHKIEEEESHLQVQHLSAPPRLLLELSQSEHRACHS